MKRMGKGKEGIIHSGKTGSEDKAKKFLRAP
jgi:hypothetical protein